MPTIALSRIASILKLPAPSTDVPIEGVAYLAEAGPRDLSFLGSEKFLKDLEKTKAAAVLMRKNVKLPADLATPILLVDDADLAIAQILELFAPPMEQVHTGIDPSAKIATTARIDPSCRIGPNVVIGERSQIGPECTLHANVYIGSDVTLGANCEFFPNVVIRQCITIGQRVVIHAGSVLGTDGFGYRWDGTQHAKIPHIGTVIIEDDVEIGSCVCIDRGKFGSTRIGRGTKIDNLVQVAHNCQIGPYCILVGQCGLAGSAKLGAGVVIAGQAAIRDHISIGDRATVTACAAVMSDVEPKAIVTGLPALPHRQALRQQGALRRLPELIQQVRALQIEIEKIKETLNAER
jgi:UDP-3-O-[3-hydroxymyristoyl] glucosamine N-acyltransferase